MPSVYPTTAEEIVNATDAIVQKPTGVDAQTIADFLDINVPYAENAAKMAVELGLVQIAPTTNLYRPLSPFANYLVTSNAKSKAAVLRMMLEQFEPYKFFKNRLLITGYATDAAATQTKATLSLSADRTEISTTFISLGTYTNSLQHNGAGRYAPVESEGHEFLEIVGEVVHERQVAETKIRGRLGEDIYSWIDTNDVFNPLVDAYQRAAVANVDPRPPIVHAGNAVESFLVQVANHYGFSVAGRNGINAKIDEIVTAQHKLTKKHLNMVKYLGHIRNAADHGTDAEIGSMWSVSTETAVEYVHVSLSAIRSIYDCMQGNYII